MASPTKIFMLGITGYIGGTVLEKFLDHPNAASFDITALVRSTEKAEGLKAFGITPVLGSLSDLDIVEREASEADVVVAVADSDDLPSIQAILRGAKRRFQTTGKPPIYIHTSGAGVLSVDSKGLEATDEIYDDTNVIQMASIPITQIHRSMDLTIVDADREGYVKTYIIIPSAVWGFAQTRFAKAGLQGLFSMQNPLLLHASLDRKQAGVVGQGKNIWGNVEVNDLSTLYTVVYDAATQPNSTAGHGVEGYYFGSNDEHSLLQVAQAIGAAMVKAGKAKTDEVTTFTKEDLDKYLGGSDFMGTNCRCVANRSKAIGWKPVKTTKDLLASLGPELDYIIATGYNPVIAMMKLSLTTDEI